MKAPVFLICLLISFGAQALEIIHLQKQGDFFLLTHAKQSRKVPVEILKNHLLHAYQLNLWFYDNQTENKILMNAKPPKKLRGISEVIDTRYFAQKRKLSEFLKLFCNDEDCRKIALAEGIFTPHAYHAKLISETNQHIGTVLTNWLKQSRDVTGDMTIRFRVLNSYFKDADGLKFATVTTPDKKSFDIQKNKITQKQWFELMGYSTSYFSSGRFCKNTFVRISEVPLCPDFPAEMFSYQQLKDLIEKLNMDADFKYRLPTEQEWNFAAADTEGRPEDYAWFRDNSGYQTNPPKEKPNSFGIYDMRGNLFEITQPDENSRVKDDPSQFWLTLNGANWYTKKEHLKNPAWKIKSGYTCFDVGARLVRSHKSVTP